MHDLPKVERPDEFFFGVGPHSHRAIVADGHELILDPAGNKCTAACIEGLDFEIL